MAGVLQFSSKPDFAISKINNRITTLFILQPQPHSINVSKGKIAIINIGLDRLKKKVVTAVLLFRRHTHKDNDCYGSESSCESDCDNSCKYCDRDRDCDRDCKYCEESTQKEGGVLNSLVGTVIERELKLIHLVTLA